MHLSIRLELIVIRLLSVCFPNFAKINNLSKRGKDY
jgi:hypothetical protein